MTAGGRGLAVAVALLLALLVVPACGIPGGGTEDIDAGGVPFGLLEVPSTTTTVPPTTDAVPTTSRPSPPTTEPPQTTTTTMPPPLYNVDVWFVREGLLVPARRGLDDRPTPQQALDLLDAGPTDEEEANGLRSTLTEPDLFELARVATGTATVTLQDRFFAEVPAEQVLAFAQIVYTVTDPGGVGLVQFTQPDGTPIDVPRGDGQLVPGAVSRDDYASLVSPGV